MKLTGRWFPQIVDRDSGNLYPIYIYITKIVVLVSEPVRGRSRATELPCLMYGTFDISHNLNQIHVQCNLSNQDSQVSALNHPD